MRSVIARRLGTALSMAVLVSCGGGGGGTSPADISTPQGAAQALVPALTVVSGGFGGVAANSATKAPMKQWTASARGAKRSMAQRTYAKSAFTQTKGSSLQPKGIPTGPCETSGRIDFEEFDGKDANSPFTESDFYGYREIWRDCKEEFTEGDATYSYYDDGYYEEGYAEVNEGIGYGRDGGYVFRFTYEDPDEDGEYTFRANGVAHHDSTGAAFEERIDYNISEDDFYAFDGDSETLSYDAFIGTGSEFFEISSTQSTLSFTGTYGLSTNYPECEAGKAHVDTPNPLTYDGGTGNLVGLVVMESGGDTAEVTLNADGSADISVNDGAPTHLSAGEIDTLVNACPYLGGD